MRLQDRWLSGEYKRSKNGPFHFFSSYSRSPRWLSRLFEPVHPKDGMPPLVGSSSNFQTLPGSILHNIMITVWGKCLLGMKKRSCGWKMMFPHNYARTVWDSHPLRPPLHLLAIGKKKEAERILLLPAASKLWSESERCAKYHSCILRSMTWLPESWDQWCPHCSHCRLLLFCFFFFSWSCATVLFFLAEPSRGAISCSIISGRQMEKMINTGKVVFIQCRLTSNTCFFFFPSAKIFKGCSWTCGRRLKKYIYKAPRPSLRPDPLLRGQTNTAQQELISASFEGNRLIASLNPGEEGGLHLNSG